MNYSEAAYFNGNHCAHVAAYMEQVRLGWRVQSCYAQLDRRKGNIFVPVERRAVSQREMIAKDAMRSAA